MEIDPTVEVEDAPDLGQAGGAEMGAISSFMKEFSSSIPGIDELMSFAELMKHVQSLSYDVTVFDTAPTGHTLRLLSLPGTSTFAVAPPSSGPWINPSFRTQWRASSPRSWVSASALDPCSQLFRP